MESCSECRLLLIRLDILYGVVIAHLHADIISDLHILEISLY